MPFAPELDATAAADYRASRERMSAVAAALDAEQAALPVPACPEWDVLGLMSHVSGIATDLARNVRPEGGDTQAWVDRQVAERRDRTLRGVIDEWSQHGPVFESMIEERPQRWWGLTYDVIVHEYDLYNALGRAELRDGDAATTGALLGLRLVELDLAKHALPAIRVVMDGEAHVVGDGEPELTLRASPFEVLRLLGSRRTIEQVRAADLDGDLDRYVEGIFHMDLPESDLGET